MDHSLNGLVTSAKKKWRHEGKRGMRTEGEKESATVRAARNAKIMLSLICFVYPETSRGNMTLAVGRCYCILLRNTSIIGAYIDGKFESLRSDLSHSPIHIIWLHLYISYDAVKCRLATYLLYLMVCLSFRILFFGFLLCCTPLNLLKCVNNNKRFHISCIIFISASAIDFNLIFFNISSVSPVFKNRSVKLQ